MDHHEELTPAEQRYLERTREAQQRGLTLKQYYRSSGLSPSWLHKVRGRLLRKGVVTPEGIELRPAMARGGQFVEARVTALLAMKSIKGNGTGPLAPHLEGFAAHLVREGYCNSVLYGKCALARELNCWLAQHNLALIDIHEVSLQQFQAVRRRRRSARTQRDDAFTVRQLLGYLHGLGCVPAPVPIVDRTALGKMTRDFEIFLRSERGLSPATITGYLCGVRRFLAEQFKCRTVRLRHMHASDLDRFILSEARRVSRSSVKAMLAALRCFLRYALQRGTIKTDLATGLPRIASWRLSHLPKSLDAAPSGATPRLL